MPHRSKEQAKQSNRRYYERNKNLYLQKSREQRERKRRWLDEIKSVPCMDCGVSYPPYVMDFDHRDPSTKTMNISRGYNTVSEAQLAAEIEKCDIVCANCHRIRTFN